MLVRNAEQGGLAVVAKHGHPLFVAVPLDDGLLRHGVHVALAIKLFQDGTISLGRATKLAGLDQERFIDRLSSLGIPVADYAPEELDRELETLSAAARIVGSTVNQFIVQAALREAERIIQEERVIRCTERTADPCPRRPRGRTSPTRCRRWRRFRGLASGQSEHPNRTLPPRPLRRAGVEGRERCRVAGAFQGSSSVAWQPRNLLQRLLHWLARVASGLGQNPLDARASFSHRTIRKVLVLGEQRQIGEMGRAVVAEDEPASRILAVVAVVQMAKPFILNREGFVDLEKAAGFESHADTEIRPVAGEQFFDVGLNVGIAERSQQRLDRPKVCAQGAMRLHAASCRERCATRRNDGSRWPSR